MGRFRALVAVGLTACGGTKVAAVARPAAVMVPTASVVAPVAEAAPSESEAAIASAAAPVPSAVLVRREPCQVLREIAEAARRSFPEELPGPALQPCVVAKGGAYAMALSYAEDASDNYGPGYVGKLVLLHADEVGRVARSAALSAPSTATYATTYAVHGVADYDGDGTDELLLDVSDWEFEGNGDYGAQLWHVAGEHVEPYGPAEKIRFTKFDDIDHDGLPDLVLAAPFRGVINGCGPDGTEIEFGPSWAMHAESGGGFGFDEASRAAVLRTCPKRPTRIVPRSSAGIDNTELRRRLACAAAWGVKSEAIAAELTRDCPKTTASPNDCGDYEGVLPICVNVPQLAKWAAAKPPFTLP